MLINTKMPAIQKNELYIESTLHVIPTHLLSPLLSLFALNMEVSHRTLLAIILSDTLQYAKIPSFPPTILGFHLVD